MARADRFASVIDGSDYFGHVKAAMLLARHRIMLIGWGFDARTPFERATEALTGPNQLGAFLYWMLRKRPALETHLLGSNLRLLPAFDRIWYGLTPVSLVNQISSKRIHFAVDGAHPTRGRPSPENRGRRRRGGVLWWRRPHPRPMGQPYASRTTATAGRPRAATNTRR